MSKSFLNRAPTPASPVRYASDAAKAAATPPVRLTIEDVGQRELRLTGELDMDSAPTLERLLDAHRDLAVLDLRGVTFIDSCGLTVLVAANRESGPLTLRSPTEAVTRVLELTGVDQLFHIDRRASDSGGDPVGASI